MWAVLAVVAALLAPAPAPVADDLERVLRVATFNIHHGVGADGLVDLDRIATVLRRTGADVIGLQEVDRHFHSRSGFVDQATVLAAKLGMDVAFAANLDLEPAAPGWPRRQYGTAILSRYPILDSDNTPLPRTGVHEQRGLLRARIGLGGVPVQLYTTHLQHDDATERLTQAQAVRDQLARRRGALVLLGDLNVTAGAAEITTLTASLSDAWGACGEGSGHSYPGDAPAARVDYVMTSRAVTARWAGVHADPLAVAASDHLPVVATLSV
ncbi:metal-dependent hydrolase [Virgisporangium aliadipatigenens]|uniref:Metal-dependent hydrolase n=1 Tax=Virgisporangium aliadipatigenens TaxID=741659 RepID=A0A8J3YI71_9ACTN|nr:endonuclease/exonuclease/phosphatase family protein [Virgisporangium aliadipatigenens]GIJ44882.1 metal-dependent hydrolase [Virgisporangium aliadipatigenens]